MTTKTPDGPGIPPETTESTTAETAARLRQLPGLEREIATIAEAMADRVGEALGKDGVQIDEAQPQEPDETTENGPSSEPGRDPLLTNRILSATKHALDIAKALQAIKKPIVPKT